MARELRGALDGQALRVGIIVSQFNEVVTSRLLDGAREAVAKHGVREQSVTVAWVPGALELPQMAKRMADAGEWDALVVLGCVVRGETAHFDYVSAESARGIADVARESGMPVAFGVLTTNDMDQAMARSGGALGNRGFDAVEAAIKMANLYRELERSGAVAERVSP
jgi:6,7-dimethyl-8-ribityllumazine synthase